MFNFVRRWLFNRNRFIFVYWNGQKIVKGDPMVFWRSLQQHEDYREDDFKLIQVEGLRNQIFGKLSGVVRDVFGIKTAEEGGLTELECLDILRSYIEYSGFQKKSGEEIQTLPSTTEQESLPEQMEEQNTSDVSAST
jgi:hypothetical protein